MKIRMDESVRAWDNTKRKWIYFHRIIVERMLGRPLSKEEQVHHKDGNPQNNSLNNLQIVTSAEHIRSHRPWAKKPIVMCKNGCSERQHARG